MKYRAKITNIIPQIKNVKKYENAHILFDAHEAYIEADREEEAELIEEINRTTRKEFQMYKKLIEITSK